MPAILQNILNKIKDWWKNFSMRQKVIIVVMTVVVISLIGSLTMFFSKPNWIVLKAANSDKEAQSIQKLLSENKIEYKQSSDGKTFSIKEKDSAQAQILLGTNDIASDGYNIKDVVNGSFSTTEADKKKKYRVFLEKKFEQQIEKMDGIAEADVNINVPNDDGTIIASKEEASAAVKLTFAAGSKNHEKMAASIAHYMAANLKNSTTDKITIIDNSGNTLFNGTEDNSETAKASSYQEVKENAEKLTAKKVKEILAHDNGMNSAIYDNVDVGVHLSMNFSQKNKVDYHYYVDKGQTQGYLDSSTETNSVNDGNTGGVPGTDTNKDDTTYVTNDNGKNHSESSSVTKDYLPSEEITTTNGEVGKVNYDDSSITIVATNFITYDEKTLKKQGKLKGISFDEFRAKHSERKKIKVSKEIVKAVSQATGIPESKISVVASEVPLFRENKNKRELTDYLQILIALLVFGLLGFVVFRTFKKEKEEEVAEEVSVDDLLKEQKEENLEDIGFNEKSEARVLIEKFVDENPDAVANLLRNWLNEDWG